MHTPKPPLADAVLRQAVTIAADAIICVDAAQMITFFNDGAVRIFGYTADEVLGKPMSLLLPERFHGRHHEHIHEFARSPTSARLMGERRAISGRRRDGAEFPAEAAIARVSTPAGDAFSVVLRDVTERHRFEEENKQLVRELQQAVSTRDEMLSTVSHDLRNPVNAVKMLAAAILRTTGDRAVPTEVSEHAAVMLQAANQMDSLIQDLLDVSHLESGRMLVSPEAIPAETLLLTALETLRPLAEEKGVALDHRVPATVPSVDADPMRMEQVLSNLVGNAIKYTPTGGRIEVSARADGDFVHVTVTDTGVGIPEQDLPRIFDRFWQARRTNRSGAGLGLTIARGIVRAHGGRIWVESTVGVGTRMHFTLPRAPKGPR